MNVLMSSLIAGLLTGVGALFSILIKKPSKSMIGVSLGFAAGVMIAVSFFALIPESLSYSNYTYSVLGLIFGVLFMLVLEKVVPHDHDGDYLMMGYFIALGIAIHNFPVGLAIGAASSISLKTSMFVAILIGVHNIVEGVAVSLPLHIGKLSKVKVVLITTLSGLSTLLGTYVGLYLLNEANYIVSLSMSFAAGAMLYISFVELIPNGIRENKKLAYIGLVLGLLFSIFI